VKHPEAVYQNQEEPNLPRAGPSSESRNPSLDLLTIPEPDLSSLPPERVNIGFADEPLTEEEKVYRRGMVERIKKAFPNGKFRDPFVSLSARHHEIAFP